MRQYPNLTGRGTPRASLGALGAVQYAAPEPGGGVGTMMQVGDYEVVRPAPGLGGLGLGPDLGATSRTVGWVAAAVWAYARFGSKDVVLEHKARIWALGGFAGSVIL